VKFILISPLLNISSAIYFDTTLLKLMLNPY